MMLLRVATLAVAVGLAGCAGGDRGPDVSGPPPAEDWSRHDLGVDGPSIWVIRGDGAGYLGYGGVDGSGAIWTSADGVTWVAADSQPVGGPFVRIVAGGPGFVALAAGTEPIWTSPDGLAWAPAADGPDSDAAAAGLTGLAIRDGALVAVGRAGFWWSADGDAWRQVTVPGTEGAAHDVAAGQTAFAAVGSIGIGSMEARGAVWTSADGTSWERVADGPAFDMSELVSVAVDGAGFIAGGWASDPERGVFAVPTIWRSAGGSDWRRAVVDDDTLPSGPSTASPGALEGAIIRSISATPAGWVGAGTSFRAATDAAAQDTAIWTSTDGDVWRRLAHHLRFEAGLDAGLRYGAAHVSVVGDRVFVAGQTEGPQSTLWISPAQPGGSEPSPRPDVPAPVVTDDPIQATPAPTVPPDGSS